MCCKSWALSISLSLSLSLPCKLFRVVLAECPDVLRQLEAVKDSVPLSLELFGRYGALQFAPEQH